MLSSFYFYLLLATSNVPDDLSSWYKCIGSGKTCNSVQEYGHIASDLYVFGTQVKLNQLQVCSVFFLQNSKNFFLKIKKQINDLNDKSKH